MDKAFHRCFLDASVFEGVLENMASVNKSTNNSVCQKLIDKKQQKNPR